jgi:hypothetical protein
MNQITPWISRAENGFDCRRSASPRTMAGENVEWSLGYASVQPDRVTAAGVGEINLNADFCIEVSRDTEAAHIPCDRDPYLRA